MTHELLPPLPDHLRPKQWSAVVFSPWPEDRIVKVLCRYETILDVWGTVRTYNECLVPGDGSGARPVLSDCPLLIKWPHGKRV